MNASRAANPLVPPRPPFGKVTTEQRIADMSAADGFLGAAREALIAGDLQRARRMLSFAQERLRHANLDRLYISPAADTVCATVIILAGLYFLAHIVVAVVKAVAR